MFKATKEVVLECWNNKYRLWRLAMYDMRRSTEGTALGTIWYILNPTLQILVYWLVFTTGIRAPKPLGEYPYIIWLITGIVPWFFINDCLMGSMTSIFAFKDILKRTSFPVSLMPIKTVITAAINHLLAMVIVIALFLLSGNSLGIHAFGMFYYFFATIIFMFGYSLFASAITTVFKDFQKIMASLVRLLFYLSPVLWAPINLSPRANMFFNLNPIAYLINGYRNTIMYNLPITTDYVFGISFWIFTFVLIGIGSLTHMRLRDKFMDII